MMEVTKSVLDSFDRLAKIEPGLIRLLEQARSVKDDRANPFFCANVIWYGRTYQPGLKRELKTLVGWHRLLGPKELQSEEAYSIAYAVLYEQLPDCRGCGCF